MTVHQPIRARLSFYPARIPTDLFIGGTWRKGSGGDPIDVFDPSSGQVISQVANASVDDALGAVAAAHDALPGWAATAPRNRSAILRRCFDLMIVRKQMHAELSSLENG